VIVTLLSDFGLQDEYAGVVKGVILSVNPAAVVVDICHQIPAGDIRQAAWLLSWAWSYFSPGTVHVVVVDPGVGSKRRILCCEYRGHRFLVPDNGVLSVLLAEVKRPRLYMVSNRRYFLSDVSQTFHGRDIFAPVAAHLSLGLPPARLGPPVRTFERFPVPKPSKRSDGSWVGEIIQVDRFGNAVTNLTPAVLERSRGRGKWEVEIGGTRIPSQKSYAAVKTGSLLAIFNSRGFLEIALSCGSAAENLGISVGDTVILRGLSQKRTRGQGVPSHP